MHLTHLPVYQFQQCGLSSPVGPNQCHPRLQVNAKVKVLVNPWPLKAITEADTLYHDHRRRNPTTVREHEGDNLQNRQDKMGMEPDWIRSMVWNYENEHIPYQPQLSQ